MSLNREQIQTLVDSYIVENTNSEITAAMVNEILTALNNSNYNILSDRKLFGLRLHDETRSYEAFEACIYDDNIYYAITNLTPRTFNFLEWVQITDSAINGLSRVFADGKFTINLGGDLQYDTKINGNYEYDFVLQNTNLQIGNGDLKAVEAEPTTTGNIVQVGDVFSTDELLKFSKNTLLQCNQQNGAVTNAINSYIATRTVGALPSMVEDSYVTIKEGSFGPLDFSQVVTIENSIVKLAANRGGQISLFNSTNINSIFFSENIEDITEGCIFNTDTSLILTRNLMMKGGINSIGSIVLGSYESNMIAPNNLPLNIDHSIVVDNNENTLFSNDNISLKKSLILGNQNAITAENYYIWNSYFGGERNVVNSAGTGGGLNNCLIMGADTTINSEYEHNSVNILGSYQIDVGSLGEQNYQLFAGMAGAQTLVEGGYYIDLSLNTSALVLHQNATSTGKPHGFLAAPIEETSLITTKYFGKTDMFDNSVTVTAPVAPRDIVMVTVEDNRGAGGNYAWVSNISSGEFTLNVHHSALDSLVFVHWQIIKNNLTLS